MFVHCAIATCILARTVFPVPTPPVEQQAPSDKRT